MTGPKPKPTAERFWPKVHKSEDCWEWMATKNPNGYGIIRMGSMRDGSRSIRTAHRVSYVLCFGPIPAGAQVLHRCDNRACVRPEHLFLGTHQDNMDDMTAKNRQTQGMRQHRAKLTPEDVVEIRKQGTQRASLTGIGRQFGVDRNTIRSVLRRETWKHVAG